MIRSAKKIVKNLNLLKHKSENLFRVVLLLLALSMPQKLMAGVFNPDTFELANGMRVVLISNDRAPVITHMVWYKVGAADEGPGETGIAHFLEHLMFKGTKKYPDGEFSKMLSRQGGNENAFTSYDYTAYHQTIAADRLEMVMEMEADRMTGLILSEEIIAPERLVVLEERRSRVDNDPATILREQVMASMFLNHPYRRPVIGWEHEIKALDREKILAFYHRWYAPNNAVLVVAGDVTVAELKPLAEKYYGSIPRAETPARMRPSEPPQRAARTVIVSDARVQQPFWTRRYLAPSFGTGAKKDVYALQVLSEIMSGGTSSRLYKKLVIEDKLTVSAGSFYDGDGLGPGQYGFYGSPMPGVTMAQIAAAIDGQIELLLKEGVTDAELAQARTRMQATAIYARDGHSSGARIFGAALTSGISVQDVEAWPERIGAVTVEQIASVADKTLIMTNSVTSHLLTQEISKETGQ